MRSLMLGMMIGAAGFYYGMSCVEMRSTPPSTQFVGTIPCGEVVRGFLGSGPCQSVMWRVDLGGVDRGEPRWALTVVYGANSASSVGQMPDAPSLSGKLEKSGSTYRLISGSGRSISFRQVSPALIHLLDENGRLMVGTGGWGYTLSRSDMTDDPGRPEQIFGGSYTLSRKVTDNTLFGMFGGRTPCMGLVRALHITLKDGCQRLKWRITLLQNTTTHEPTTYRIEGSLHHPGREGAWHIVRGTADDPNAVVYQLDASATEGPMLLWRADDNVLFLLDESKRPLVGTADFAYTLSRAQ